MENKFYLHIKSENLPHYYGCACIKPTKYFTGRTEDIQTKYADYLLLSAAKHSTNSDCSIELILTKEESNKLLKTIHNDEFFFMLSPLPISRISAVYFENEELKDKISTLINISTAFIPKRILKTFQSDRVVKTDNITAPSKIEIPDHSEQLQKYNSLLGGFALMKLAREPYMNFSENYF